MIIVDIWNANIFKNDIKPKFTVKLNFKTINLLIIGL